MSTKTELIEYIASVADADLSDLGFDEAKRKSVAIALGTPGQKIEIAGSTKFSGSAMAPEPTVFSTMLEGVALWLDASGAATAGADVVEIKTTLNELVDQFNQLLTDYNAATVPSSALPVTPIT